MLIVYLNKLVISKPEGVGSLTLSLSWGSSTAWSSQSILPSPGTKEYSFSNERLSLIDPGLPVGLKVSLMSEEGLAGIAVIGAARLAKAGEQGLALVLPLRTPAHDNKKLHLTVYKKPGGEPGSSRRTARDDRLARPNNEFRAEGPGKSDKAEWPRSSSVNDPRDEIATKVSRIATREDRPSSPGNDRSRNPWQDPNDESLDEISGFELRDHQTEKTARTQKNERPGGHYKQPSETRRRGTAWGRDSEKMGTSLTDWGEEVWEGGSQRPGPDRWAGSQKPSLYEDEGKFARRALLAESNNRRLAVEMEKLGARLDQLEERVPQNRSISATSTRTVSKAIPIMRVKHREVDKSPDLRKDPERPQKRSPSSPPRLEVQEVYAFGVKRTPKNQGVANFTLLARPKTPKLLTRSKNQPLLQQMRYGADPPLRSELRRDNRTTNLLNAPSLSDIPPPPQPTRKLEGLSSFISAPQTSYKPPSFSSSQNEIDKSQPSRLPILQPPQTQTLPLPQPSFPTPTYSKLNSPPKSQISTFQNPTSITLPLPKQNILQFSQPNTPQSSQRPSFSLPQDSLLSAYQSASATIPQSTSQPSQPLNPSIIPFPSQPPNPPIFQPVNPPSNPNRPQNQGSLLDSYIFSSPTPLPTLSTKQRPFYSNFRFKIASQEHTSSSLPSHPTLQTSPALKILNLPSQLRQKLLLQSQRAYFQRETALRNLPIDSLSKLFFHPSNPKPKLDSSTSNWNFAPFSILSYQNSSVKNPESAVALVQNNSPKQTTKKVWQELQISLIFSIKKSEKESLRLSSDKGYFLQSHNLVISNIPTPQSPLENNQSKSQQISKSNFAIENITSQLAIEDAPSKIEKDDKSLQQNLEGSNSGIVSESLASKIAIGNTKVDPPQFATSQNESKNQNTSQVPLDNRNAQSKLENSISQLALENNESQLALNKISSQLHHQAIPHSLFISDPIPYFLLPKKSDPLALLPPLSKELPTSQSFNISSSVNIITRAKVPSVETKEIGVGFDPLLFSLFDKRQTQDLPIIASQNAPKRKEKSELTLYPIPLFFFVPKPLMLGKVKAIDPRTFSGQISQQSIAQSQFSSSQPAPKPRSSETLPTSTSQPLAITSPKILTLTSLLTLTSQPSTKPQVVYSPEPYKAPLDSLFLQKPKKDFSVSSSFGMTYQPQNVESTKHLLNLEISALRLLNRGTTETRIFSNRSSLSKTTETKPSKKPEISSLIPVYARLRSDFPEKSEFKMASFQIGGQNKQNLFLPATMKLREISPTKTIFTHENVVFTVPAEKGPKEVSESLQLVLQLKTEPIQIEKDEKEFQIQEVGKIFFNLQSSQPFSPSASRLPPNAPISPENRKSDFFAVNVPETAPIDKEGISLPANPIKELEIGDGGQFLYQRPLMTPNIRLIDSADFPKLIFQGKGPRSDSIAPGPSFVQPLKVKSPRTFNFTSMAIMNYVRNSRNSSLRSSLDQSEKLRDTLKENIKLKKDIAELMDQIEALETKAPEQENLQASQTPTLPIPSLPRNLQASQPFHIIQSLKVSEVSALSQTRFPGQLLQAGGAALSPPSAPPQEEGLTEDERTFYEEQLSKKQTELKRFAEQSKAQKDVLQAQIALKDEELKAGKLFERKLEFLLDKLRQEGRTDLLQQVESVPKS